MVSVMLYPYILCVALLVYLFVLWVACLTVFVNCLMKQFAICFRVVAILLLHVMTVFSVGGCALLDRPKVHRFTTVRDDRLHKAGEVDSSHSLETTLHSLQQTYLRP